MNEGMKHWMDNSSSMNPRWIYPPFVAMVGWYEPWVWCPYQTYTETNRTLHVSDLSFNHLSLSSHCFQMQCEVCDGHWGDRWVRSKQVEKKHSTMAIHMKSTETGLRTRCKGGQMLRAVKRMYSLLSFGSCLTKRRIQDPCRAKEDFNHTLKTTGWMGWKEKLGGQVALRSNPIGCRSKAWILIGTQPRRRRGGVPE